MYYKVMSIKLRRVVVAIGVIVMIALGFYAYAKEPVVVEVDKSGEILQGKIDGLKDDVVEKLKVCESGGYSEDDGIIILDSNSKHSIGQFQYQKTTVQHFYKTLYGKDITKKEAVLIALDTDKAGELTKDVLFGVKDGWKNWLNCGKKIGLASEIALIKKLEN